MTATVLKWCLYVLTAIAAMAGALVVYWLVHEVVGYSGNKNSIFYIGGMFVGGYMVWPLWWLYRRRYPKQEKQVQ